MFLRYLNKGRISPYEIVGRPDEVERRQRAVDYILRDDRGREIAAEVTSIWRSQNAGGEDAYWINWTQQVRQSLHCKLPGTYHVYTELRVPRGLDSQRFADKLMEFISCKKAELASLYQNSKGLNARIGGTDVFVAKATMQGSDVEFARSGLKLDEFPEAVKEILRNRVPKLRPHKNLGRETWLVIYNTMWPAMSPIDVQRELRALLDTEHSHVDQVGAVAGNPPDDAWMILIR